LVAENNRDELAKVVTQYNALGHYDEAKELQEFLDRNETTLTSDLQDLTKLRDLRAVRILNYGDVAKAKLTEEDKAKFLEEINTQRDANVQAALRNAKTQLNVSEDDLENKLDQLPDYKKLQRVYYDQIEDAVYRERDRFVRTLRAKIRSGEERTAEDFFDAESLVRGLLVDIQTKEKARQISVQNRIVEIVFKDLTSKIPEAQRPPMERAYFNSVVASGRSKADKAAAKRALQALKLIDEINRRP
jgi:ribonucleotide reductase alpha subunit